MTVVVLGATGTTGRLVCAELLARGVAVHAVGRNRQRLAALASQGCATTRASLDQLPQVWQAGDFVLGCVGPFYDTSREVARRVVDDGAHWLDITGEQRFVRWTREALDGLARARGVLVSSAVGVEVLLADMAGALAAGRLDVVERLDSFAGLEGSLSHGSARTLLAVGAVPAETWQRGWQRMPARRTLRRVHIDGWAPSAAIALPMAETATLPTHVDTPEVHSWLVGQRRLVWPLWLAVPLGEAVCRSPLRPLLDSALDRAPARRQGQGGRILVSVRATGRRSGQPASAQFTWHGQDPYVVTGALVAWLLHRLATVGPPFSGGGWWAPSRLVRSEALLEDAHRLGLRAVWEEEA